MNTNTLLLQSQLQPPFSSISHSSNPYPYTSTLHHSPPFNLKLTRSFLVPTTANYTNNPSDLSLTTTTAIDQKLLTLLRERKTEEAWILYNHSTHLPNTTCLSRLVSQLSHQNTLPTLTLAQSIVTRLRHEHQLHRLDANYLGLLAVSAAKSGHVLYAASLVKSMLRSGFLPHVKAWSAVVSRLAFPTDDDDGANEALKLFKSVMRRLRKFPDPVTAAESWPDTAAFNAALNACANLGDSKMFLQVFDEMPQWGVVPDALSYNILIKLCCRIDRKNLLVFVLERVLQLGIRLCMTTLHSLVAAYVDFGDMETAEKLV